MASKKSKGATLGALVGARVAPKAGKAAGRAAWRAGKGQARLTRRAVSSQEPSGFRFLKYGFFALVGLVVGALISRSGRDGGTLGETWGTGTPTGASPAGTHQRTEDPNRTGAERAYSDPSTGPLIGEQHRGDAGDVPVQHEEVEN